MAEPSKDQIVEVLLERYDRQTIAEQAGITLKEAPNTLFQLFMLGVLQRVRVDPGTAVRLFQDLRERTWTTAGHLRQTRDEERLEVLGQLGLSEADAERVSLMLGDAALHVTLDHGGDLGRLRLSVDNDPDAVRERLTGYAAVDDVVVDAFFREVQLLWGEPLPFADKRVLDAAGRLGLGGDAEELRPLTDDPQDFVRLEDALVRLRHEDDYDGVIAAADERSG